mgnify:FL=1
MKYLASCSFGKDSIAAIITHLEHGGRVDEAVYCRIMFNDEISAELPEHEEWIYEKAIPKLKEDWGIETTVIYADKTYTDYFYRKYEKGQRTGEIYGFPMLAGVWCNSRLKVKPFNQYKNIVGECKEIIGIAADEPNRMKSKRNRPDVVLPLVEHGITQKQSFEIAERAGLLSLSYNNGRTRLGCWFCHNQRIKELRRLRKEYPCLWEIMLQLDKDSPVKFTPRTTVHDFEERFAIEDRQLTLV